MATIDLHAFARKFQDKLLSISAENQGVMRVEALRKYNTDPKFQAMVNAIVAAAVTTLHEMEHTEGWDPLQALFNEEAAGLLGWNEPDTH